MIEPTSAPTPSAYAARVEFEESAAAQAAAGDDHEFVVGCPEVHAVTRSA